MEVKEFTSAAILVLISRQASSAQHQNTRRVTRVRRNVYVNKIFVKIRLQIYTYANYPSKRIIPL